MIGVQICIAVTLLAIVAVYFVLALFSGSVQGKVGGDD